MCVDEIRRALVRELATLRREVMAYPSDDAVWACPPGIANSAGTLALHVAGGLLHFIGSGLGNTGYVRDRDAEFSTRGVARRELDARLAEAAHVVDATLAKLDASRLDQPFPLEAGGVQLPTGLFLQHLAAHVAYHLGQVDYHRRIVTGSGETVGAISAGDFLEAGRG
jgi:uncharacterized damage-inducible protein DinB